MPRSRPGADLLQPQYERWIGRVLPALGHSLGLPLEQGSPGPALPELAPAGAAVLVLIDGLGSEQLLVSSGHAPFLTSLAAPWGTLESGFPSTTATSTASLGTALPPGGHGLLGWQTLMPHQGRLLNHLSWDGGPDPEDWQPHPTAFERLVAAGAAVTRVGPAVFERSGLTRAALRGGDFVAADSIDATVAATVAAVASSPRPALVYSYFGQVDKAGHVYGPDSWQWGQAVADVDEAVEAIAAGLPSGTSLTVTADHGMVEAPERLRWDLAHHDDLADGVWLLGGEPRSPQPYTRPGAAEDVLATWRGVLGDDAVVLSRDEAVEAGWFGPVDDHLRPRIGDLVVAMRGGATVLDSAALRPAVLRLKGHHGSLTPAETQIPFLHSEA